MALVGGADPMCRFKMRFSIRRFENAMKSLSPKQQDFLILHGFDIVLDYKYQTLFPLPLIEWIMENMVPALAIFQHGSKRINFNKNMIQQFLGIYSGDLPAKLSSNDPEIIAKVNVLKQKYMTGNKLYTKRAIELLAGDEDEESFMTTFMLVFLATIVCPATSDTVDWRVLYSLTDLSTIKRTDWGSLCLQCIVTEVGKFMKKLSRLPNGIPKKPLYVGGCLPVLPVVYMDMLDLNPEASCYQINYGVPRILNVCTLDFQHVTKFDRVLGQVKFVFGAMEFRSKSSSPYTKIAIADAMEKEFKRNQEALCSLRERSTGTSSSHQTTSSNPAPNASLPDIIVTINSIIQSHKSGLLRDVHDLVESRVSMMAESIYSALSQHVGGAGAINPSCTTNPTTEHGKSLVIVEKASNTDVDDSGIHSPTQRNCSDRVVSSNVPSHPQSSLILSDTVNAGTEIAMAYGSVVRQEQIDGQSPAGIKVVLSSSSSQMPVFDQTPVHPDSSKVQQLPVFDETPISMTGFKGLRDDNCSSVRILGSMKGRTLLGGSDDKQCADESQIRPINIDNSKRKKRHGKTSSSSHDDFQLDSGISHDVFYEKYLQNHFLKAKKARKTTIVVDINGHTVTYENFYNSFKARGDIDTEVMVAFVEVFNERVVKNARNNNSRMKISFSPYFTSKLIVHPDNFDVKCVARELRMLNQKFNLAKCDLLHFPLVHGHHWTSLCVNLLFQKINLLDSLQEVNKASKSSMANNMVTNFNKACIETKCLNVDLLNFEHEYPEGVPQQTTTFDCGVFVMFFMENFNGHGFNMFRPEMITELRKVASHDIASSSSNNMSSEVRDFKKMKLV